MFWFNSVLLALLVSTSLSLDLGLYPRESETREVKLLNGFWNFRVIDIEEDQNIGFTKKWYSQPLSLVRPNFQMFAWEIPPKNTTIPRKSTPGPYIAPGRIILQKFSSKIYHFTKSSFHKKFINQKLFDQLFLKLIN